MYEKTLLICAYMLIAIETFSGNIRIPRFHKIKIKETTSHRAPYNGASITSYYDAQSSLLTIMSHSKQNDVEITITKNGEEVVHNVFDMGANEGLEYDFTESESGEYTLYVTSRTDILFIESFIVF